MTWPSKSAFNFRISARFDFPIDFHSSPPFPPTFSNANFARNLLPLTAVRKGERENLFLFLDSQFSHFYLCLLLLYRLCRRIQARMSAANATATADIPIVLETWKDIARTGERDRDMGCRKRGQLGAWVCHKMLTTFCYLLIAFI